MLFQRRRRWNSIDPALGQRVMFSVSIIQLNEADLCATFFSGPEMIPSRTPSSPAYIHHHPATQIHAGTTILMRVHSSMSNCGCVGDAAGVTGHFHVTQSEDKIHPLFLRFVILVIHVGWLNVTKTLFYKQVKIIHFWPDGSHWFWNLVEWCYVLYVF